MLQQCIVADSKVRHVRILVAFHVGTDLQVSQLYAVAEIDIAGVEAGNITDTAN